MKNPTPHLRILILEDNEADAELVLRELSKAGLTFDSKRVETKTTFLATVETFRPDVILSDYSLPEFTGLAALRWLNESNIDTPFILCTGASNEETAVECMKEGAADYILKTTLKRLPSAVLNAIEKSEYRESERRANAALRASEQRLQQSQKLEAIGTLTGGVAHDFNNLLMSILGNTQLALRKTEETSPIHARLAEIEKAASRAAELTRKLLAYSRRQHLERRTIDLGKHIAEIIQLLDRVIGADVNVVVDYQRNLPAVFADPSQIEQVIMNLCINARDAMPDGGTITIDTKHVELDESYCIQYPYVQPGDFVRITISDTGTGMNESVRSHIFEPFFTTKEQGKGTGLGLSMAYGIVKQHEGHLHVQSEEGVGTVFEVFLPVDLRSVEEVIKPGLTDVNGTETILVAEDEEPLRNLAKDILEEMGYRVLIAKDGEEAVQQFIANRDDIDLLLFDVVMPGKGGIDTYETIRKLKADIPLVLMTGYSSETVQSRFVTRTKSSDDLGAIVIQKPYEISALGQRVREALDKSKKENRSCETVSTALSPLT